MLYQTIQNAKKFEKPKRSIIYFFTLSKIAFGAFFTTLVTVSSNEKVGQPIPRLQELSETIKNRNAATGINFLICLVVIGIKIRISDMNIVQVPNVSFQKRNN